MSRPLLLPHAPASVTSARRSLCSALEAAGVSEARVDDATLVLSELMSNALRHAAPLPEPFPPGSVGVSWKVAAGSLEIAICDGGSESLPRIARPSISALGGRGLGIVERIATRWGTEVDDQVTTVWAILDLSAQGVESAGEEVASGSPEAARPEAWNSGASMCCEPQITGA
ncbi:ATP-binding protein [Allosalinactinospora lopnorensis]|uniref:ATP-binding protein n=1 Tax=Allosalinactinospora lopnorensis TaxID=1352348 RepID=UPI0009E21011|nr:ATP-binding protein [Allosalinactinospora lopnorensis]